MEPVRSVVNASAGPRAALRVMRDLQTSATFVLRRDRSFAGVVLDRDVLKQVKAGDGDLTAIIREATAVSADTALVDLVELAVESDLPIAVIDDRRRLLGVIPRVTLLAALGNVSTNTGELQVNEPPSTISMSIITETLRDTAPEGVQP
jgi:glycine betaine/proline transport system ATP-binding protein